MKSKTEYCEDCWVSFHQRDGRDALLINGLEIDNCKENVGGICIKMEKKIAFEYYDKYKTEKTRLAKEYKKSMEIVAKKIEEQLIDIKETPMLHFLNLIPPCSEKYNVKINELNNGYIFYSQGCLQ